MEFLIDPSIWVGLFTLVVLEIVLGIDNLVFVAILAEKLPPAQRDKTRLIGLSLALVMRLVLLSVISWMVTLTKPLFSVLNFTFSGRDLIMLLGGLFLLLKATIELRERLGNSFHNRAFKKNYTSFEVVVQIVVLDVAFSLDAVITAVGMANHLPMMMVAVVIAMGVMLLAAKPLNRFVNEHPTVALLCLGFLLMIGLSLLAEGFGFHIPKSYLYAAIGFSIVIELFNQIAHRNFMNHQQSTQSLRGCTADPILDLISEGQQNIQLKNIDNTPVSIQEKICAEKKHHIINGVLSLSPRSLRDVMTPRSEINWINTNLNVIEIRKQLLSSPHSLFPVCRGELDEIIGLIPAKELLIALKEGADLEAIAATSPPIIVPETLDLINLLSVLQRARNNLIIIKNEFNIVQGLVTPLDILGAIVAEFPDVANETLEIVAYGNGWFVKGTSDFHASQDTLRLNDTINDKEDIPLIGRLIISINNQMPRVGDVIELPPLRINIIATND